ncbi:MAG: protease modulator HflC [Chloroflexota bacterium]|nr:protease modulator HflC [Chloroflexota bacterium]
MRRIATIIIVALVVLVIGGRSVLFTVDETKLAIVTRFGEIQNSYTSPGLYMKVPFIDSVTYFDGRLLIFDAPKDSLLTKDKKRLIIDVYARAKISNPKLFRETVMNEMQATSRAVDIITSEVRREVASDNQSEVITTKREAMMGRVEGNVKEKLNEFGIEVIDVRIKRADFPEEIADSVYARMQAERKRKADKERAEGAEVDAQVRADVDRQATIIRANAEKDANIIRGCGEAEATGIFADAFSEDPDFFTFQKSLEANATILTGTDTVIMEAENFGNLFEQIRTGIIEASSTPKSRARVAIDEEFGSSCAEVAAFRRLATELSNTLNEDIDTSDLELLSSKAINWPDVSLGCPEEGRDYQKTTVPGFSVSLSHQGTMYQLNTNTHGSQVKFCPS